MPPDPDQKRSATADEIRQAALEQFAQVGYAATSMRDIAGSVGIKAASLYNHFGSKEAMLWDLTLAAFEELIRSRDAAMAALPITATAPDRLAGFVSAHVAFHAHHSNQALLVNSQLAALTKVHYRKAVALRTAYEITLRKVIDAGVGTGDFATPDARVSTFAILQMGMAVSAWYRPEGSLSVKDLCAIYAELALKMLDPSGDRSPGKRLRT
jgi:AcrR family transcriptional regulator